MKRRVLFKGQAVKSELIVLMLEKSRLHPGLRDLEAARVYREGLRRVLGFVGARSDLCPGQPQSELRVVRREEKEIIWTAWKTFLDRSQPYRLLEAISEGVSFTTLEHSAACDALAVLRPRLAKAEKAEAIRRAFRYAGVMQGVKTIACQDGGGGRVHHGCGAEVAHGTQGIAASRRGAQTIPSATK